MQLKDLKRVCLPIYERASENIRSQKIWDQYEGGISDEDSFTIFSWHDSNEGYDFWRLVSLQRFEEAYAAIGMKRNFEFCRKRAASKKIS